MIQVRRQDEWAERDMAYITASHHQSPYQPGDIVRVTALTPEGFPVAGNSRVILHAPGINSARAIRILTTEELEHLPAGSEVFLIRDLGHDKKMGDRIVVKKSTRLRASLTYALISRPGVLTLTGRTLNHVDWTTIMGKADAPAIAIEQGHALITRENLYQMQTALDRVQADAERQTHQTKNIEREA